MREEHTKRGYRWLGNDVRAAVQELQQGAGCGVQYSPAVCRLACEVDRSTTLVMSAPMPNGPARAIRLQTGMHSRSVHGAAHHGCINAERTTTHYLHYLKNGLQKAARCTGERSPWLRRCQTGRCAPAGGRPWPPARRPRRWPPPPWTAAPWPAGSQSCGTAPAACPRSRRLHQKVIDK